MALLSDEESELINRIHPVVKINPSSSGLKSSLNYLIAIYMMGEGPIIEKALKQHFLGMDEFETILYISKETLRANPPFTHLLLDTPTPKRAQ